MTREGLKTCVRHYLESEEYDVALADKLVRGTMERVGALVSRVEGTFEFEVQPLREYFTAWHLYKTAKYSPAGAPTTGTKPDRFDALARSFYWTNVTRFYCGFYDKGELGSLVEGLIQLSGEDGYNLVSQPRGLAMMLLGDQVFAQSPRTMKRLIAHMVEEPGFQRMTASNRGQIQRGMGLPEMAGREFLFEACLDKLDEEHEAHRRRILRQVIAENASIDTLKSVWRARFKNKETLCAPLREATDFGIIGDFTASEMRHLTKNNDELRAKWFVQAGRYEEVANDDRLSDLAQKGFFDGQLSFPIRQYSENRLPSAMEVLSEMLSAGALTMIFSNSGWHSSMSMMRQHRLGNSMQTIAESLKADNSDHGGIGMFAARIVEIFLERQRNWTTHWGPWEELVDTGFAHAPSAEIFVRAALISTAVDESYTSEEKATFNLHVEDDYTFASASGRDDDQSGADDSEFNPVWGDDGFAPTPGLVGRLQVARANCGAAAWWANRLDDLGDGTTRLIGLATLCLWATPSVIAEHQATIDAALEGLDYDDWVRFTVWINIATRGAAPIAEQFTDTWFDERPDRSMRLNFALVKRLTSSRTEVDMRQSVGRRLFSAYDGQDPRILKSAASLELTSGAEENVDWDYVSRLSQAARRQDMLTFISLARGQNLNVPAEAAKAVLAECERHCSQWVAICERAYQTEIAQNASKVSSVAEANDWYSVG